MGTWLTIVDFDMQRIYQFLNPNHKNPTKNSIFPPPEVVEGKEICDPFSIDIWNFGLILMRLLTCDASMPSDVVRSSRHHAFAIAILDRCMHPDPLERPQALQLLNEFRSFQVEIDGKAEI
eukprot:TRINITY_DN5627_c0_g1_i3.p1 TRINITY_DN5627_c0_g1~~TRINITY_DN5627_c0_g1_i3.p1  ORF type:complete len:121 (+),score=44.34 TRINITY_DN5627_c0_g1_i3:110-472(+)